MSRLLETERLLLRPPVLGDAPAIARWLGDFEIAKNMASIPYPLTTRDAEHLVKQAIEGRAKGEAYSFVILRKDSGRLLGFCSISLNDGSYMLSYWLGQPFWGHGLATEALKKLISFALRDLKAERIEAVWPDDNPAAANVLGKLGFAPATSERRYIRARGETVLVNRMALNRETYGRKRSTLRAGFHQRPAAALTDYCNCVGA
jgi:Acetyltransferases, including N-acetylases of ribosomal proteins